MRESPSTSPIQKKQIPAIIELVGGDRHIYPIVDSDADEMLIFDALRFVREDYRR